MSRITSTFRRLGRSGEIAAIPYLPVGWPDVQTSRSLLPVIGRQGADLIALGTTASIPWPGIAPGLQANGAKLDECLSISAEARRTNEVPLVLVTQLAVAQAYGVQSLASGCASSGIDGLLITDLTPSDFAALAPKCTEAGVDLVPVVSKMLTDAGFALLRDARGFIYYPVDTLQDTTWDGIRERLGGRIELPLVIGANMAILSEWESVTGKADGVLARDGLADISTSHPRDEIMLEVSDYVHSLKEAAVR